MRSLLYSAVALLPFVQSESLPNSCLGLEDGTQWIKFLDGDEYPAVQVECSNEYAILDYNKDNNIKEYFNTWTTWHQHTAGPTNDVHINWQEWFLPTDSNTKFLVSPDCSSCEHYQNRQVHGDQSTYWMTGTLFGCFWAIKGAHNCDVDWDTDTCYTCLGNSMKDQGNSRVALDDEAYQAQWSATGICPHNVQPADHYVPLTHDDCTHEESQAGSGTHDETNLHFKPSIGIHGEYCVCVQPSSLEYFETETIPAAPLQPEVVEEPAYQYISLKQEDFKYGTYRITKPGTYTIMEDITFDFNAVPDSPNSDGAYLPHEDQAGDYPGADDFRNAYFLGFFAGITVETDNVILDLNGHTLKMSDLLYYQQRWFTIIELSTQYFLPGQGIGNFGAEPKVASNVIIKDGTLGLTTHHGIHGNYNSDILIQNVVVKDFETCGIQFNGFSGVTLKQIEVGPTSNKAFFNGEYGHMRLLLPRYRKIAEETIGETVQFYGRETAVTMHDIADELEKQMNYAFDFVVHGKVVSEDDHSEDYESFKSAIELFVNEEGVANGGAQYGIFLNTFGASVFTYNLYTGFYSENAVLEDVTIHGMRHNMDEYIRLHYYKSGDIVINPFNGPLELRHLFETIEDFDDPKYKGNILTDAYMASNYLSDNFGYLQLQLILNDKLVKWAMGDADFYTATGSEEIQIGCNSDVMIHSGKGISGLRLDGVDGVTVKNLKVYDIYDESPVGVETCGEYSTFCALCGTTGGHFRQTEPMQSGFTGNMAQAINVNAAINVVFEDVEISDIKSNTGPTFGFSIWPACDVTIKGDIDVERLEAGMELEKGIYDYNDRPNKAPETCAVRAHWAYSGYTTSINTDDATISTKCVAGHVGCHGSTSQRTMLGDYDTSCDIEDWDDSFMEVSEDSAKSAPVDDDSDAEFSRSAMNNRGKSGSDDENMNAKLREAHASSSHVVSFLPKQTVTSVLFELAILSIVIFAIYKIYNKTQNRKGYDLVDSNDVGNEPEMRNVVF